MVGALLALLVQAGPLPCGDDGARYQVVYATPGEDRRDQLAGVFAQVAGTINTTGFGGYRALRLACGVRLLPILPGTDYQGIVAAIEPEPDRKFLVLVDTADDCGWGTTYRDDQPGQENENNVLSTYAIIWAPCWYGSIPAHEVFHSLGAVQRSAPYADRDFHCLDLNNQGGIFDCSMASYYDPDPAPGTYLADHWNTANSRFLDVTPFFPRYLPAVVR